MATYSRDRTNLALPATPRARPSQVLQHVVPDFVGASRGIDPSAGHAQMSQAMGSFFGSLQNSLNTVVEGHRAVEKHNVGLENQELAKMAQVEAGRTFEQNKDANYQDLQNAQPRMVTLANGEVLDPTTRRSFTDVYSSSIGTLSGQKLIRNLKTELKEQQVTPENWEGFVSNYWENNYSQGTGNPYHDKALQDAWQKEIDTMRLGNEIEVIGRAQAKRLEGVNEVSFSRLASPEGLTQSNYLMDLSAIKSAMPHYTDGQARSHVLSQYIQAGKTTANGARQVMEFMDRRITDEYGRVLGESLNNLFPQQMQAHQADLHKAIESHTTITGTERMAALASQLSTIETMPIETSDQLRQQEKLLAEYRLRVGELNHVPGTSLRAIADLKSKYAKAYSKTRNTVINRNKVFAMTDKDDNTYFPMSEESLKEGVGYLISRYNFLETGDPQHALELGRRLHVLRRKTNNYIPQQAVEVIGAGLTSTKVNVQRAAMDAARALDPKGEYILGQLEGNTLAFVRLSAAYVPGAQPTDITDESLRAVADAKLPISPTAYYRSNGELTDTEGVKPADTDAEFLRGSFFGTGGDGTQTLAQRITDTNGFYGAVQSMSPDVRSAALRIGTQIIAQHQAKHMGSGNQTMLPLSELKDRVAAHLAPITVLIGKKVELASTVTSLHPKAFNNVPLARSVLAPNGEFQDTAKNMSDALELISEGFTGLHRGGEQYAAGSSINAESIVARKVPSLAGKNTFMLYDDLNSKPLLINVNKKYETQTLYGKDGKEYGWWARAFNWGEADEDKTVKFTGNLTSDTALARRFLHPAISLIPMREGNLPDGKVLGYNMGVSPYFEGDDGDVILKDMVNREGPWVEDKPKTPLQRKMLDPTVKESTKLNAWAGLR